MGFSGFSKAALTLLFSYALSTSSWAIETPLRDPAHLIEAGQEKMVRVNSARVIFADYDLLKKDFPELRAKNSLEIDQWLLENTAFISKPQAAQERVNTKISTTTEERAAFRPKDYGRAIVFKAGDSGLIDAKGAGSLFPGDWDHSNGLASLGEAIREYLYERLVNKIFKHSNSGFETVRNYAVIDLGFDIKSRNGSTSRAGMVLRQAHERSTGKFSLIENKRALKIEKLLRRYGVTSAGAYRNDYVYEWLNIQGTKDGAVLDFGGFLTVEKYEKPLIEAFHVLPGAVPLITVKEARALKPDPAIRVPLNLWGSNVSGLADPSFDNPWMWSHELAESLRNGSASRENAEQHLRNLLDPVEQIFAIHPANSRAGTRAKTCKILLLPDPAN